ncbi:MAG: PTS sugar transporter subunit IIB [Anaerolineae bacterium]|nr:PTS sugar transporter subunit IIB [Anaerolineae bacterium]
MSPDSWFVGGKEGSVIDRREAFENKLWARVDDRLIHGQVVVGWRQHLCFQELWVADDEVAADAFMGDVLRLAAPAEVEVRVQTVAQAAAALSAPLDRRTLLLFKEPQAALALVEAGVPLAQLNVGNLAARPGSRRAWQSISLTQAHAAALDALAERGVSITFQSTPDDAPAPWAQVRRRISK